MRETSLIGVEVEFLGLSARAAAQALCEALGGGLVMEDRHAFEVTGSRIGDVAVELDIRHAHPQRHGAALSLRPGRRLAGLFGDVVSPFVPREMILPQRPADRLGEVDEAIDILRRAGARGDGREWGQTLGLHLNISTDELDAESIRAFALAYARLDGRLRRAVAEGDARLGPLLPPPYPEAYVSHLQAVPGASDIDRFIDDYLRFNPTRDRALDLLPLLLHLDGERVRRRLPFEKIAARPVYHWRLPVSRIGRPGWSVLPVWEAWREVEAGAQAILQAG